MNLKDKTRISVKKNVYLSLTMAIICLVFSMFVLVGSTWAWFSAEHQSSGNTITIGDYSISLSIQKMDKAKSGKLLTMVNEKRDTNEISSHEITIDEKGDYLLRIIPTDKISGYCNLKITDDDDNSLLEKDSLIIKIDQTISFNIHTNKKLKVSISNVNWGNLAEYDELESDYNFADFKFIYENGTIEYSDLPNGYKEVTYIDSNGKQHTDDIVINGNTIVNESTFLERIVGKNEIVDENDQTIAYIYPCVNDNGVGGLYVFDLLSKTDKFYPNIGEGNFEIGEEVKHYSYTLKEDNVDVNYKDVVIEGTMAEDETVYTYGIETDDVVKDCAYMMEGFHFVGWKYEDELIENLNDVLTVINPTAEQEVVLTAVWDIDHKILKIDGDEIDIKYRDELVSIEDIPEEEGYTFKGYYLDDELIIDADGNFVKDPFDWSNSEENEIVLEPRWEVSVDKTDEKNNTIETSGNENTEEETDDDDTKEDVSEDIVNDEVDTSNQESNTITNADEQGGKDE